MAPGNRQLPTVPPCKTPEDHRSPPGYRGAGSDEKASEGRMAGWWQTASTGLRPRGSQPLTDHPTGETKHAQSQLHAVEHKSDRSGRKDQGEFSEQTVNAHENTDCVPLASSEDGSIPAATGSQGLRSKYLRFACSAHYRQVECFDHASAASLDTC